MTASNWLEEKVLNKVFRNVDFTITGVYAKLHTGDPGEDCTANAATETTRKACTFNAAVNPGGTIDLASTVSWPSVAANETFTHVSFWDAVSGGNPLGSGTISSTAVIIGQTFQMTAFTWTQT